MGRLIYFMNISIDGYLNDKNGNFDWAEPKEDVHRHINNIEAMNDVLIYGRKMYDALAAWQNIKDIETYPDYIQAYEKIWKSKRKIVFSRSLKECKTSNTVIKSELAANEIEKLKIETPGNISIGGADMASQALDMNLVDEIILFVYPVIVGKGKKWIDNTNLKRNRLIETKQFGNDVIMVKYSVV